MNYFYFIKQILVNKIKSLQLDQTRTKVENIPFETSKMIFQNEYLKIHPLFKPVEDKLEEISTPKNNEDSLDALNI
jgi:hypothetical protein